MSYYFHNVAGRLRIKSPVLKNNKNIVDEINKILSTTHGIIAINTNITTGSLTVNYDHRVIKHNDIIDLLQRKKCFDLSKAVSNDKYLQKAAEKVGNIIGKSIFSAFVQMALEGTPLSFISILI